MNSFERVMRVIQGQPVDRIPVFAVLGAYGTNFTRKDLKVIYSQSDAWVESQLAIQDAFGFDVVLAGFDYSAIAEAFGGEVAWFTNQAPNVKRPVVKTLDEALGLALPDPFSTARLPVSLTSARVLSRIYREKVPVFGVIPGPASIPSLILGLEGWLDGLLFDDDRAKDLMKLTGEFFVNWANALFSEGVTALVVTEGMASAEILPRALFQEKVLPVLSETFAKLNGPVVLHHTGGRLGPVLDLLPGLPNLLGVVISSKDDLIEARSLLGPDLLLIGNLDNLSFPKSSVQKIKTEALHCLEAGGPSTKFILANSGADIPMSTDPLVLKAFLEASHDYAEKIGSET